MKRKSMFSPAMDELLRDLYPKKGGEETRQQVNKRFNKKFSLKQIHGRCRSLYISAPRVRRAKPQSKRGDDKELKAQASKEEKLIAAQHEDFLRLMRSSMPHL